MASASVFMFAAHFAAHNWGTILAASAIIFLVVIPIAKYLYDPYRLRRFPAASKLAAITPIWCAWNSYWGRRFTSIQQAHERLGPVVRISPSHVSFTDPAAIKDIYGHSNGAKVMKDEFYDNLAGEFHNIANVRDREEHSRKRKYFSNAFALKTVVEFEPTFRRYVDQLIKRLDAAAQPSSETPKGDDTAQGTNINRWLNFFTFDVIGEIAVGQSFGFLETGSDAAQGQYKNGPKGRIHEVPSTIVALHSAFSFKVALGQFSRRWYLLLFKLFSWAPGKKQLDLFTSVAINQVRKRLDARGGEYSHTDFFERVLLDKDGTSRELPFMELVSEAIVLLNAGSDTTSSSLTSLVYEVARHPEVQSKLHEELDRFLDPTTDIADFDTVKDLPYLKSCLNENLRLNPPIPYGPPRVVVDPRGAVIAGHHILPGTTISVPTYSVHRRADVFADPEVFRPERWLEGSEADRAQMQTAFNPFSTGSRSCLGRNLAMMEQQVVLSTIFHRYEVRLAHPDYVPPRFEAFNLDPGPLPVILRRRHCLKAE